MAGENLVRPKGFKAKIQNFWYHYKFHTLVFLVVFVTLFISVAQCAAKTDYDYKIIVATRSMTLSTPQLEAITTELKQYGEDLNGNGSVDILLVDCTMDSNESDYQTTLGKQQRLQTFLMAVCRRASNSSFSIRARSIPTMRGRVVFLSVWRRCSS